MTGTPQSQKPWRFALRQPAVWRRAATVGLSTGVLQVAVNQGDHWLHHQVDAAVVAKTILSPLITFSVALVSAAGTYADKNNTL